tara:strand:+ start:125 stop:250 length:126 start_codon:yes stop_codon:yes gene_type:complete
VVLLFLLWETKEAIHHQILVVLDVLHLVEEHQSEDLKIEYS